MSVTSGTKFGKDIGGCSFKDSIVFHIGDLKPFSPMKSKIFIYLK